jgi:predicted helicase
VAISILVKDPGHKGPGKLHYFDIGDYLSREEKLAKIEAIGSIADVEWQVLTPNIDGDWADQRDPAFEAFFAFGDKDNPETKTIFTLYSLGVVTNRDAWVYSFSRDYLANKVGNMLEAYAREKDRYLEACEGLEKKHWPAIESVVDADAKKISWTRSLKADAARGKELSFDESRIVRAMYRPFTQQWLYYSRRLNEMVYQTPKLFPTTQHSNLVISATGVGSTKGFSALVVDEVPDLEMISKGQCFPLYWYEKVEADQPSRDDLFGEAEKPDEHGYVRRDGISAWALELMQSTYTELTISKEDVFWYVYGVLHSPEYKQRRKLPRQVDTL